MAEQLQQYYSALPIIENENLLLTVASTLGQTLWGSAENFSTEFIEYAIPDRRQPIPILSQLFDTREQKFPLKVLEKTMPMKRC